VRALSHRSSAFDHVGTKGRVHLDHMSDKRLPGVGGRNGDDQFLGDMSKTDVHNPRQVGTTNPSLVRWPHKEGKQ